MRGAALVAVTFATASCSWLQSLDKDQTLDWSADKLYSEARLALDDSNWTQAKDYYQKLEARYPFGQYAQQAQIELIYATWKDGDAPGAVQAADRFLRTYPNHANSDYVMYLKALATLNETAGSTSSPLKTSLNATPTPRAKPSTPSRNSRSAILTAALLPKPAAACTASSSLRLSMN